MSAVENAMIAANRKYAEQFNKGTTGALALPPSKKYLVVTCMDARIDPAASLGIELGSAHIIRNAGGSARDAIRSIIISEQLLGTDEIFIFKHTGCGMLTFSNSDARAVVQKNLGDAAVAELGELDFLPFPTLEGEAKADVEYLKSSKLVPEDVKVSGWIYEVETGEARRVA